MSRHFYTYSADFIRALGSANGHGVVLSRADASAIRRGIAKALGMPAGDLLDMSGCYGCVIALADMLPLPVWSA